MPRRPRHGAAYRALDPALSLWVHATLIDAILRVTDRWQGPLPPDVRARFYAETRPVGRLFGVPDDLLPRDVEAFDAYVAGMLAPGGPIHPTRRAREIAPSILHPPLDGVVGAEWRTLLGGAPRRAARARPAPQPAVDC